MSTMGLLNPITVIKQKNTCNPMGKDKTCRLIAGGHRLAATKKLGWVSIDAGVLDIEEDDLKRHRLIEISENLHRAELSALERSWLTKVWVELTREVSGQVDQKPQGGRPEGGLSLAARKMGVDRKEVERSMKIASLSDEAQAVAKELDLEDSKSVLLDSASKKTPEKQADTLRGI